jgi:predicted PP-loop superfamily ATPase
MNKSWVNKLVRNIRAKVSKEFSVEIIVKLEDTDMGWVTDFEFEIVLGDMKLGKHEIIKRGVTVRNSGGKDGYTISRGIHSPANTQADLIQQIICGKVANRLLKENNKINAKKLGITI